MIFNNNKIPIPLNRKGNNTILYCNHITMTFYVDYEVMGINFEEISISQYLGGFCQGFLVAVYNYFNYCITELSECFLSLHLRIGSCLWLHRHFSSSTSCDHSLTLCTLFYFNKEQYKFYNMLKFIVLIQDYIGHQKQQFCYHIILYFYCILFVIKVIVVVFQALKFLIFYFSLSLFWIL